MGTCGCISGNPIFKLKAPKGWYIIELLSGCDYCSHGPGIQISHPEAAKYFVDEIKEISELPIIGKGEHCVTVIKCGLDPDEAKNAAAQCFVGSEIDDNGIDETLAEILGEDFWKDALCSSPSVILPKG